MLVILKAPRTLHIPYLQISCNMYHR